MRANGYQCRNKSAMLRQEGEIQVEKLAGPSDDSPSAALRLWLVLSPVKREGGDFGAEDVPNTGHRNQRNARVALSQALQTGPQPLRCGEPRRIVLPHPNHR